MNSEAAYFTLRCITCSEPVTSESVILLNKTKAYTLGRTGENDIVCKSERVSRKHCNFFCYPENIYVQDLKSVNGVYVNGKRQAPLELIKLNNNDIIGIGTNTVDHTSMDISKFVFRLEKKQAAIDLETQISRSQTQSLEGEQNYQPRKLLKLTYFGNDCIKVERTDHDQNFFLSPSWRPDSLSERTFNIHCIVNNSRNKEVEIVDVTPKTPKNININLQSNEIDNEVKFLTQINNNQKTRSSNNLNALTNNNEESHLQESDSSPEKVNIIFNGKTTSTNNTVRLPLDDQPMIQENPIILDTVKIFDQTCNISNSAESELNYKFLCSSNDKNTNSNNANNGSEQTIRLVDYDFDLDSESTINNNAHLNENKEQIFDSENATDIDEDLPMDEQIVNPSNESIHAVNEMEPLDKLDLENSTRGKNCLDALKKSKNRGKQDLWRRCDWSNPKKIGFQKVDNRILTRSLFLKVKQLEKRFGKFKNIKVALERLNIQSEVRYSKYSKNKKSREKMSIVENDKIFEDEVPFVKRLRNHDSELSKRKKNRQFIDEESEISEDDVPLAKRFSSKSRNRDSVINEANYQLIVDDSQSPIDEVFRDTADAFISQIVAWNPADFQTTKRARKKRKPILTFLKKNYVKTVSQSYESFEKYRKMLTSDLLFDIACKIKNAGSSINKTSTFIQYQIVKDSATKTTIFIDTHSNMFVFDLSITLPNQDSFKIAIGDLIRLQILGKMSNSVKLIFAYVKNVTFINEEKRRTQIICTLMTKLLMLNIYSSTILDLQIIVNLIDAVNLVKEMSKFKLFPLLPLIMNPAMENYQIPVSTEPILVTPSSCLKTQIDYLNCKQFNAVNLITNAVASQDPKICLIEGPPGTGKTTIIVDSLVKILQDQRNSSPKILVCAKSKSEVDEIMLKISSIHSDLDKDIKMVRIGDSEMTNPLVKDYSLQILANRHVDLGIKLFLTSEKTETAGYDSQEQVEAEYSTLKNPSICIKLKVIKTCFEIRDSKRSVREINNEEISKLVEFAEKTLLSEANVIISTMNSSSKMDSIVRSVCIIDEATQISEIEILKYLNFKEKTLVLFGDGYKSSLCDQSYEHNACETEELDNSLFSRLKANFDSLKLSPIIKLDHQYRYNFIVSKWLNKFIYDGGLISDEFTTTAFPLFPFTIFKLDEYYNADTHFLVDLLSCILNFTNFTQNVKPLPLRIGIIVPDTSKYDAISAVDLCLTKTSAENRSCVTIDVDTISGFQNQEREIVIVSCTETISDKWLYSAVTRVKHSLMLYGSFKNVKKSNLVKSLMENENKQIRSFVIKKSTDLSEIKSFIIKSA